MSAQRDDAWQRFGKRMLTQPSPEGWTGIIVRVVPESTALQQGGSVRTPAHFLGAAWRPAASGPTRFPEFVVIGSPAAGNALGLLFDHLPRNAKLHLAGPDHADAALAAEILLAVDRNLEAYQREAIARFMNAERERVSARIKRLYTDRDAAYERFRDQVTNGKG